VRGRIAGGEKKNMSDELLEYSTQRNQTPATSGEAAERPALFGFSLYYFPILKTFLKQISEVLKTRQFLLKSTLDTKFFTIYGLQNS